MFRHDGPALREPAMAANYDVSPKRPLWHPTWIIPFIALCVLAGVFGCLTLLGRV